MSAIWAILGLSEIVFMIWISFLFLGAYLTYTQYPNIANYTNSTLFQPGTIGIYRAYAVCTHFKAYPSPEPLWAYVNPFTILNNGTQRIELCNNQTRQFMITLNK